MRVMVVHASGMIERKSVSGSLRSLQREVGGLIGVASRCDKMAALVNNEGRISGLQKNRRFPSFYGNILLVGVCGDEYCSLTADQELALLAKMQRRVVSIEK